MTTNVVYRSYRSLGLITYFFHPFPLPRLREICKAMILMLLNLKLNLKLALSHVPVNSYRNLTTFFVHQTHQTQIHPPYNLEAKFRELFTGIFEYILILLSYILIPWLKLMNVCTIFKTNLFIKDHDTPFQIRI